MKLPVVVRLDDGQMRVYDTIDEVLQELELIDIENNKYQFYDSQGYRLRHQIERSKRKDRIFGLLTITEEHLRLYDYYPPLDRSSELDKALRDYMAWPGFRIPPEWVKMATLDELISRARQLLW